jgi:sulfur-carrier protein
MIRVVIPYHLQNLAKVQGEVALDVPAPITLGSVLDSLEANYPTLQGAIREHVTLKRRPLVRFFACEEDISKENYDFPLPAPIASGKEPLFVIGAIAGG